MADFKKQTELYPNQRHCKGLSNSNVKYLLLVYNRQFVVPTRKATVNSITCYFDDQVLLKGRLPTIADSGTLFFFYACGD